LDLKKEKKRAYDGCPNHKRRAAFQGSKQENGKDLEAILKTWKKEELKTKAKQTKGQKNLQKKELSENSVSIGKLNFPKLKRTT
jgi:hypothetical protein